MTNLDPLHHFLDQLFYSPMLLVFFPHPRTILINFYAPWPVFIKTNSGERRTITAFTFHQGHCCCCCCSCWTRSKTPGLVQGRAGEMSRRGDLSTGSSGFFPLPSPYQCLEICCLHRDVTSRPAVQQALVAFRCSLDRQRVGREPSPTCLSSPQMHCYFFLQMCVRYVFAEGI